MSSDVFWKSPPWRHLNRLHFFPYADAIYRMSPELSSVDKASKNWLPRKRPLPDRKTNFRSFICSHGSTKPGNLAKIAVRQMLRQLVRKESVKIKKNKKQQQRSSRAVWIKLEIENSVPGRLKFSKILSSTLLRYTQNNFFASTDFQILHRPMWRRFHRAMLCIRGTSHGPVSVSVCLSVCHKSEFY